MSETLGALHTTYIGSAESCSGQSDRSFVLALSGAGLMGGLLLTAAVIMVSVHQDFGLKAWIGVFLGSFIAIAFGISALVEAIRANLRVVLRSAL